MKALEVLAGYVEEAVQRKPRRSSRRRRAAPVKAPDRKPIELAIGEARATMESGLSRDGFKRLPGGSVAEITYSRPADNGYSLLARVTVNPVKGTVSLAYALQRVGKAKARPSVWS